MIIMHILLLILFQRIKSRLINLILGVIYRPFELEIFLNDGLLRPKTMPEKLLNCSKPNELSKSPKNNFFGPKNGQIAVTNFGKSVDFWLY